MRLLSRFAEYYTLALVVAAFITAVVIGWQSWETRKSAEAARKNADAMAKQVKLQETAMRQWVNLQEWNIGSSPIRPKNELVIGFQIANPTSVPVGLDIVRIRVGDRQLDEGIAGLLAPGNPYIATVPVALSDKQMADFDNSRLVLVIGCSIFFTDSMGRKWEQIFGRMLVCGIQKIWVTDTKNRLRSSEPPHNNENPNPDSTIPKT